VDTHCETFLTARLTALESALRQAEQLAAQNELPDAEITNAGLKITPLTKAVPEAADTLMRQAYAPLPPRLAA